MYYWMMYVKMAGCEAAPELAFVGAFKYGYKLYFRWTTTLLSQKRGRNHLKGK